MSCRAGRKHPCQLTGHMNEQLDKLQKDLCALLEAIERENLRHKAECADLQAAVDECKAQINALKGE